MMVSTYAAGLLLTLATMVATGGNEVDAVLEVLGLIELKKKIVTGDALHCNRKMAEAVLAKGGDYCLALKGNQESLLSDARVCLSKTQKTIRQPKQKIARISDDLKALVVASDVATGKPSVAGDCHLITPEGDLTGQCKMQSFAQTESDSTSGPFNASPLGTSCLAHLDSTHASSVTTNLQRTALDNT